MPLAPKFYTAVCRIAVVISVALAGLHAGAVPKEVAARLRDYEQNYVNRTLDTTRIPMMQDQGDDPYSPEVAAEFIVESYWVDARKVNVYSIPEEMKKLGVQLERVVNGRKQVLFLVHPQSKTFFASFLASADRGPDFSATATSSSRTLFVWLKDDPSKIFFGKLSLDKQIGKVFRTIPAGEISRSLGNSEILREATLAHELPDSFAYFPEVLGVMPKGMERGGMILRAFPRNTGTLIPLFALYTTPKRATESPIAKMIRDSGMTAREFVLEKIIKPYTRQWVELAVEHGISIEAHAQNVLMELNKAGQPSGRFVYRDFGGFNISLQFRRQHRLPMPSKLATIAEETEYYQDLHELNLQQSVKKYFEGGFLYGLSGELEKQDARLNYSGLTELFHDELVHEMKSRSSQKIDRGNFYESLSAAVLNARTKVPVRGIRCEGIL